MSTQADIAKDTLRIIKAATQKAPVEISAYISGNFTKVNAKPSNQRGSKGLRKAKSGRIYWNEPNQTKHLRRQYGNLIKALQVGGKGNVSNLYFEGPDLFVIEHTFDEDTVVNAGPDQTKLVYGAIHERTGRPFMGPGMEQYLKERWPKTVKRLTEELAELFDRDLR